MCGRFLFLLCGLGLAACGGGGALEFVPQCVAPIPLTAAEVTTIITQAANRSLLDGDAHVISVVTREGVELGTFAMTGAGPAASATKARSAAFLSSDRHSFNTRTAAFIIADHFPPTVGQTPGGPLYGVQFSSLPNSDIVGAALPGTVLMTGTGLSGDPGSLPLYKGGCLVGAVGVDGGASAAGEERSAWSGALGFRPDPLIYGSVIFIDGVSLAFLEETPPDVTPTVPFGSLSGAVLVPPMDAPAPPAFATAMIGGLTVEVIIPAAGTPFLDSPSTALLAADVDAMMNAAAALSDRLRAGIRRPLGSPARMFIAVVDTDGVVLGCIRTPEATYFSLDVAVQKARTAAFFSSNTAAFTTRGLGFISQGFFPPGLDAEPPGPLHMLQDRLNPIAETLALPLPNGITIFPGGVALYKGGVLVGGIGVSGDGVDQDDMVAQEGGALFPPPPGVRADELPEATVIADLDMRLIEIGVAAAVSPSPGAAMLSTRVATARMSLAGGLQGIRLPYVKFPRQPFR
ncbi:MAG: heme-binding protein [Planctomycetota bacterium]|nr:heme-binding protein [Planctomycetota bacterium]